MFCLSICYTFFLNHRLLELVSACLICCGYVFIRVCVPIGQVFQVDTVTVPRRATEGPCCPTTEALSPCSSWLVRDFLLLSLSFSRFCSALFFSEPIFLSEVLIWGAGQWGEGRDARAPGEGAGGSGVVMAADGRPFVPPFPGSSLEPPRLQLR